MKYNNQQSGLYCLNRGWHFIEEDIPVLPKGKQHDDVYQFAKAGGAKGPAESGFDDSKWERVELPHDWVTDHEFEEVAFPNQGYKKRGIGWYRIQFELNPQDHGKRIWLEFEGISGTAEVYVNGSLLKRNFSGYQGFWVDITDVANYGIVPNVVAIKVDASQWEGWWYEGAGIYRNVWLLKKSPVHFLYGGVYFRPQKQEDGSWELYYELEVENSFVNQEDAELEVELYDRENTLIKKDFKKCCIAGVNQKIVCGKMKGITPQIWSLENPQLYTVKSSVRSAGSEDYIYEKIGFRTLELRADSGFYLNGENLKLQGFCNHQDHAGIGVAVPYTVKEYRVSRLKDLGANAYRCAHHPDPEILEICDRVGMLVLEENRVFSSTEENLQLVRSLVKTARNHPSVIGYSVFNEEPLQGTEKGYRIALRLSQEVKRADPDRFVTGAFNGGFMQSGGAVCALDAVGMNYNADMYDQFHEKYPEIPMIATEITSAYITRGIYQTQWEQHEMSEYGEEHAPWGGTVPAAWREVQKRPFIAGGFVWTGFDYCGEPTPFEWPSVSTVFGTYDSCGFEKEVCWFYRAFWKTEPVVHLVSTWECEQNVGKDVQCMVITNCDRIEVFVGSHKVFETSVVEQWSVKFTLPYQTERRIRVVGYRQHECIEDSRLPGRQTEELRITSSVKSLDSQGYGAAVINVEQCGGQIEENLASTRITFEAENGKILGVGNGNPLSHEKDNDCKRILFHGKAQAIIKAIGVTDVKVIVRTDFDQKAELVIPVKCEPHVSYYPTVETQLVEGWGMHHGVFSEKPLVPVQINAYDMNSYEPISFDGSAQMQLDNKPLQYGMYQTVFEFENSRNQYLYFGNILGNVWVYLDGTELLDRLNIEKGHIEVDLPYGLDGKHVITVIVQNSNRQWGAAGITGPVMLRNRAEVMST